MTTATASQPLKVLLVEDEPIVMIIHRRILTELGYSPDTALTGEQALTMANNGYDVIFMDIGLPDTSGTEVAAKIRQHEKGKKRAYIVALTGYPIDEVRPICQAAGIDNIANKPITADILQNLFQQYQALYSLA